ncbi:MAG: ATPase, T2SS/T4P/T4SS family [Candidatus Omnitrophica bacterium]|nr:ATPase, T2SS/T4P/T4SS family [Candidatus Omnitrophota bacterium]
MPSSVDALVYSLLVEKGMVRKDVLDAIVSKSPGASGSAWIAELVSRKLIEEKAVLRLIAEKLGIESFSLEGMPVDASLFKRIPHKISAHYQFVPLQVDGNVLTVAVYYPLDLKTQDEIRLQTGDELRQVLAMREEVLDIMRKYYGLGAQVIEKIVSKGESLPDALHLPGVQDVEDIETKSGDEATILNLVNQIIFDAYRKRATDIHIEPYRSEVRFRYRIDGVLYDANVSPTVKHFIMPILSRIKIMAALDIVEHRLPQDGQAVVRIGDERLDLRVSCIPTTHGESVVVRILPAVVLYDIEKLGLLPRDRQMLDMLLKRPHGIIFVTGPTGSGKTTTLYACLNKLNTPDRKIITIEDPVEYEMTGITQIQVTSSVGFDFARGLRSMLRHDPDIMMVGEVRDLETAEIAIRVALTGHLVFSTLHTNSAAASVHRLLDIGIEPYLISSSTLAFIAQRLVRVLCPHCKRRVDAPDQGLIALVRRELRLGKDEDISFYQGTGCPQCNNTGYYGRTAIYEILEVDEGVKELIQKKASAQIIEESGLRHGMKTLLQNGLEKVMQGVTTIEEVVNILEISQRQAEPALTDDRDEVIIPVEKMTPEEAAPVPVPKRDPRRVYQRLKRSFPITFRIYKRDITEDVKHKLEQAGISEADYWEEHHAVCDDISAGGLMFRYDLPLMKGMILAIKVVVPLGALTTKKKDVTAVSCLARVVRTIESEDKTFFCIAVCFLDMAIAERNMLNNFIEAVLDTEGEP